MSKTVDSIATHNETRLHVTASNLPNDVRDFLSRAQALCNPALGISPVTVEGSLKYSSALRRSPLGEALGVIALDDAGNFNPYCYVSEGPAKGMVLLLSHDGEPELRFANLKAFLETLHACVREGVPLGDAVSAPLPALRPQDELVEHLLSLAEQHDDDAAAEVDVLLPLLSPEQLKVLQLLAGHPNFFVRESTSNFIQRHRLLAHLCIAELLAADACEQVARPAREAVQALTL